MFTTFKLNINNYPILPSLNFGIYRSKYLEIQLQVYLLKFIITNQDILVEVLICLIHLIYSNEKVYYYDVKSLYIYVMKNMDMPMGNPINFKGDILKVSQLF